MYHPPRPLFGRAHELTMTAVLYPRQDGYVDLILTIHPRMTVDVVEKSTYARLSLSEAADVWTAQAALLVPPDED